MLHLPSRFAPMILSFAPLFFQRSWQHAEVLLLSAILAPGKRTVTSLLRISGLAQERRFVNYHRVLNRAAWSPRAASRLLLGLLIAAFASTGPVVPGIDDTIERRRGKRISAKGIYRDPVRSSHGHFVKASGLRWLSLMLLVPIPWAEGIWALPFLTALAPSERACREQGWRHKKLTDCANNVIEAEALPGLIHQIYQALASVGAPVEVVVEKPMPAVPPKRSVFPDYIVCLEDGKKLKMLKRHLNSAYGMTPADYRAKWDLLQDYPIVAPNYAEKRSTLAKQIGLGRKGEMAAEAKIAADADVPEVQYLPEGRRSGKKA